MDIPRTRTLCSNDFNVGSQGSGISSGFSSMQEGPSNFLIDAVFNSEQSSDEKNIVCEQQRLDSRSAELERVRAIEIRMKTMEVHFGNRGAYFCREIDTLKLENNELRIENQTKDELYQKILNENRRLLQEYEELLADYGRLDFDKRREAKEKKFQQIFFPNKERIEATIELYKHAKVESAEHCAQKPFDDTCADDCSASTVFEQSADSPDKRNMTPFLAERREKQFCRVLKFDESLTGECHELSYEQRAVGFEASTSVSVSKYDDCFTDAHVPCERLADGIDSSSLVSDKDGDAGENCFNSAPLETAFSDIATDNSVQVSPSSREEKHKEPDFENGMSNSISRSEHHDIYLRDLLPTIARSLLSDDILKLKKWASDKFGIDDSELKAADILFQLDQKGVITTWNLNQLLDFFDVIERIDIVYLIDAFLEENYSVLQEM